MSALALAALDALAVLRNSGGAIYQATVAVAAAETEAAQGMAGQQVSSVQWRPA
jgi:hypothetical protein